MKAKLNYGVIYEKHDYASPLIRLLVMAIDGLVVIASYLMFFYFSDETENRIHENTLGFYIVMLLFLYFYLVEMKRRWGSLGNLLTNTKVVSLEGTMPSVFSMLVRSVFSLLSTPLAIVDFFWMLGDDSRQMIRDKFTGVYVIKRGRKPHKEGVIYYSSYMLFGYTFVFKEVKKEL